jgi:hypothetical protein
MAVHWSVVCADVHSRYSVDDINGHYVWSLLTQENYNSNYVMGCFTSLIGLTLILIYFFKWLKFTQTELPPMPK